jgi:two-component system NtrC family sensor kinase
MRGRAKPAKTKVEAQRPLARKSLKNDGSSRRELEKRLAESLEREKATGEILGVIARSPTGVQPTFDAIAAAATALCEADLAGVFRFDGTLIHFVAQHGRTAEEVEAARRAFPQPPHHGSVTARALLAASVVQIADVAEDPDVEDSLRIFRTVLSVPMIRDGQPLGAITVARRVVRSFTDSQVALLKTFADQAVIAIENARLFNETKEALEQQTATGDILSVIASSTTDAQPVFETIVDSAHRLFRSVGTGVIRYDGDVLYDAALRFDNSRTKDAVSRLFPMRPSASTSVGLCVLNRSAVIDMCITNRH